MASVEIVSFSVDPDRVLVELDITRNKVFFGSVEYFEIVFEDLRVFKCCFDLYIIDL